VRDHGRVQPGPRFGVDIGRVIIAGPVDRYAPDEDTSFFDGDLDAMLRTPAVDRVFDELPGLVDGFGGRAWLVSKCGAATQHRTELWLARHRVFERTGIPPANVRFCRRRADKAVHCRELGITHFVDDRYDVLDAMRGIVAHRYLFGPQPDPVPPDVVHTPTWTDVTAAIALLSGDTAQGGR
jgi:hypothetical protein